MFALSHESFCGYVVLVLLKPVLVSSVAKSFPSKSPDFLESTVRINNACMKNGPTWNDVEPVTTTATTKTKTERGLFALARELLSVGCFWVLLKPVLVSSIAKSFPKTEQ